MIRVLIKASSSVVKAGLEGLLRGYPQVRVIEEGAENVEDSEGLVGDSLPDVILAEIDNLESVSETLDDTLGGVPLILLVRGSTAEWADAFRQRARAVLPSSVTGPQIAAAIEAVAAGLAVFDPSEIEHLLPPQMAEERLERLPESLTPRET